MRLGCRGEEAGSTVRAPIRGHGGGLGFYPVGGGTGFMTLNLRAAFLSLGDRCFPSHPPHFASQPGEGTVLTVPLCKEAHSSRSGG